MSSSSLLRLRSVLVELAIVVALSLPPLLPLRRLGFFLNQLRRDLVDVASVSEFTDAAAESFCVEPVDTSGLDESIDLLGVDGSARSDTGSSFGVGTGVTSVEGVTSTSSASRYHFLRRV
jgi:hypothetical protein